MSGRETDVGLTYGVVFSAILKIICVYLLQIIKQELKESPII
jgi:tetrahydromethanopterin S-methyltransferase subunit G